MATKKAAATTEEPATGEQSTALVVSQADDAALAALAEAGIEVDDTDGMQEFSPNDFRTPLKMFNQKNKKDANEQRVLQDMWFDSVDRTTRPELNFALLDVHKSHLYESYSQKEDRNIRVCSSFDRVTGTWQEDGHQRPCQNCPDRVWKTGADGKRKANCGEVWTAVCYSLDESKVFAMRFKRTSLDPIRNYLQAYHLGKRPVPGGKPGNIPLFTYRVRGRLEMHKSGNYALPVFERGPVFPSATLKQLKETAQAVRDTLQERLTSAEESASAAESGSDVDTSFDVDAYDAEGAMNRGDRKFVE